MKQIYRHTYSNNESGKYFAAKLLRELRNVREGKRLVFNMLFKVNAILFLL